MTDATRCPDPESLVVLLYDEEGDVRERAALQAHLATCPTCAEALTSLEAVRGSLGSWYAPPLPLGFALVRNAPMSWPRRVAWSGGLAAAAVLVLAAAASIAHIQITYDESGIEVRTGVSPAAVAATTAGLTAGTAGRPASTPQPASSGERDATPQRTWPEDAARHEPAWRADLELLATQLRAEFSRPAPQPAPPRAVAAVGRSMSDEELLKRVSELLDHSEVRQQQNLALRVTELGRQFEIQRQADIVQVEQTLSRIEQQRRDLLRRVSSTQPQP